jgi:hypothetical protein
VKLRSVAPVVIASAATLLLAWGALAQAQPECATSRCTSLPDVLRAAEVLAVEQADGTRAAGVAVERPGE